MLKNKPLSIFILNENCSREEINLLASLEAERVLVFCIHGIQESMKIEDLVEDENRDKLFFVHMAGHAFDMVKAETIDQKVDFTLWHFYYDIFGVPKFKFKQAGFTHFVWSMGTNIETNKKAIQMAELNPKTELLILDSDKPLDGGFVRISDFNESMSSNFFAKINLNEVTNVD